MDLNGGFLLLGESSDDSWVIFPVSMELIPVHFWNPPETMEFRSGTFTYWGPFVFWGVLYIWGDEITHDSWFIIHRCVCLPMPLPYRPFSATGVVTKLENNWVIASDHPKIFQTWRKHEKNRGTNQLTNIAMEIHDFELKMMYKWWIGPETN